MDTLEEINTRFDYTTGKDLINLLSLINMGASGYWASIEFRAKKVAEGSLCGEFHYGEMVFGYSFNETSMMLTFKALGPF